MRTCEHKKRIFPYNRAEKLCIFHAGKKNIGLERASFGFEACMRRCIMFLSAVGKSGVRAATVKILR